MKRNSLSQLFPNFSLWMNSENNFADPEEPYLWKHLQARKQRSS